MLVELNPL
jgi:hypothetical protein